MTIEIDLITLSNASLMRVFEVLDKIAQNDSQKTSDEIVPIKNKVAVYYKQRTGTDCQEAMENKHKAIREKNATN